MVVAALLAAPAGAAAYSRGVSDFYGGQARSCNVCHSGGTEPAVTLHGPAELVAGAEATVTLAISGGAGRVAGFCVGADDPTAALRPVSQGTRATSAVELTHAAPLAFEEGVARVTFALVAPRDPGVVTLYAAGNSANGDGRTSGDRAGLAELAVRIVAAASDGGTAAEDGGAADGAPGDAGARPQGAADGGTDAAATLGQDRERGGCATGGGGVGVFWGAIFVAGARVFARRARGSVVPV
jgi:hypothetical protein